MKKVLVLLLTVVTICAGITACGRNTEVPNDSSADSTLSVSIPEPVKNANVSADYLVDVEKLYPDYVDASETMKVNSADYETVVLFRTDVSVQDFRVFSLELNIDENGTPDFIPTEVFRSAELKEDAPIAVPLNFPGDMSLNGYCYKDSDGNIKTFTIGISGKDGSLVINAENFAVPEE